MGDIGAVFACPMISAACVIPFSNLVIAARPDEVDIIIILIGPGASVIHVKTIHFIIISMSDSSPDGLVLSIILCTIIPMGLTSSPHQRLEAVLTRFDKV